MLLFLVQEAKVDLTTDTDGNVATTSNDLRPVIGIRVTNPGSGYTTAPTVTLVRDSFTGKTAGVPNANGNGVILSTQSGIGYVQVINSGFGYTAATGTSFAGAGNSTGVNPTALFNNDGDPLGQTPTGGTAATGSVVVERGIGTVTQVDIPMGGSGNGYTNPIVTISNGSALSLSDNVEATPTIGGGNAIVFFQTTASGGLEFAGGGNTFSDNDGDLTNGLAEPGTGLRLQQTSTPYALVPNVIVNSVSVSVNGAAPLAGFQLPTVGARVNNLGQITELFISNPRSGFEAPGAGGTAVSGITVSVEPIAPRATATAFVSSGGGVGNYILTNLGAPRSIYASSLTGTTFNYVSAINTTTTTTTITGATGGTVTIVGGTTTVTAADATGDAECN